jgi:hypothetical protein
MSSTGIRQVEFVIESGGDNIKSISNSSLKDQIRLRGCQTTRNDKQRDPAQQSSGLREWNIGEEGNISDMLL